MHLTVFVRSSYRHLVRSVRSAVSATGLGGVVGNKGGLAVSLTLGSTSLAFVSCHLVRICIYVCIYMCIYISIYLYICISVSISIYLYLSIYLSIYLSMYIHICIYICMYTYIYICKCIFRTRWRGWE